MTDGLTLSTRKIAGVSVHILEGGQGRDFLFLHGAEGPDTYSDAYLRELAKSFRVIAPWHPGFGHSERPNAFSKVDDLAYFYLDLAADYGLSGAVLAGGSFGGWVAAEVAIRAGAPAFSHLILSAPLGVKLSDRETRDIRDLYLIAPPDWPKYFLADKSLIPDYTKLPPDVLTGIARSREAITLFGWQPYMHNPVLSRWLHRLALPTLFVWGDKDEMVSPDYGRAFAGKVPGSRFTILPGAGHLAYADQPVAFHDLVRDFVSGKPAR